MSCHNYPDMGKQIKLNADEVKLINDIITAYFYLQFAHCQKEL